jgi:hypothetical protein
MHENDIHQAKQIQRNFAHQGNTPPIHLLNDGDATKPTS